MLFILSDEQVLSPW